MGVHRESVSVSLMPRGDGSVRVSGAGRIEIIAPETGDLEAWMAQLPQLLEALDLAHVRRTS